MQHIEKFKNVEFIHFRLKQTEDVKVCIVKIILHIKEQREEL